jgi:glycosyltransferase involved in cell wall biosynthesis
MPLDVIIPTWNSSHMLERSLPALAVNLRPDGIIIVDRHSTDRTAALGEANGAVILTDDVSLGSARMKGVRHSKAEWIAFIDDDIIVPAGFREEMEKFMIDGVGAIQAAAVSVHEPYRSIHMDEFGSRLAGSDHFDYRSGERGFTNATLIRRDLLDGLDLSDVDTWEDWVITQRVLGSGYRWIVVRPFVDHIHERDDLAKKEGWNAAGILNLARTGHMGTITSLRQYVGKVLLAMKGSVKYTVQMRSPAYFFEYMRFIVNILMSPRHLLKVAPRLPKEGPFVPSTTMAGKEALKKGKDA